MQNKNVYYTTDKYNDLKDEEIIVEIQNGNEQALTYLLNKYKPLVNNKVGKYFIIGAEKEDIVQEGMIGLYKAIKSFDVEKQNKFKTFANMCIERQLITAVKNSNRQKHIPLNSSVSLNAAAYDDNEDMDKIDILDVKILNDPSDIIAEREYFESMENKIKENTFNDIFSKGSLMNTSRNIISGVNSLSELPTELLSFVKDVNRGETKIDIEMANSDKQVDKLEKMLHQLVIGLLDAAVLLGACMVDNKILRAIYIILGTIFTVWLFIQMAKDHFHSGY